MEGKMASMTGNNYLALIGNENAVFPRYEPQKRVITSVFLKRSRTFLLQLFSNHAKVSGYFRF